MWKEKIKHRKEKKNKEREREKKMHTEGGGKNRHLIFLLYVRVKLVILKLTFNTTNYLMKHNNLFCKFRGNFGLKKMDSGEIFRVQTFSAPLIRSMWKKVL